MQLFLYLFIENAEVSTIKKFYLSSLCINK